MKKKVSLILITFLFLLTCLSSAIAAPISNPPYKAMIVSADATLGYNISATFEVAGVNPIVIWDEGGPQQRTENLYKVGDAWNFVSYQWPNRTFDGNSERYVKIHVKSFDPSGNLAAEDVLYVWINYLGL